MLSEIQAQITVVGLGTGSWESLTIEAARVLQEAREIFVRSAKTVTALRPHMPTASIRVLGAIGEADKPSGQSAEELCSEILAFASRHRATVYAVPGSPDWGDDVLGHLLKSSGNDGISVRFVSGVNAPHVASYADEQRRDGGLMYLSAREVELLAQQNAVGEVPGLSERLPWQTPLPTVPLIIRDIDTSTMLARVGKWLAHFYPDNLDVVNFDLAGGSPRTIAIKELANPQPIAAGSIVYVPSVSPLDNVRTFAGLMNLTRTLRAPGGCPWDREQTHASLKPHLLEEAYETVDAMDRGDPAHIQEELGDLLLQISLHSQIAAEAGEFSIEDVIAGIVTKMIGRHPHVFSDLQLESAQDVRQAWESFKQHEKPKRNSVMEGIPEGLPALPRSSSIQKRAASVGFEWPSIDDVLDKVEEELTELRGEVRSHAARDMQREEFGDILFALVSVGRHLKIDPEEALRLANRKFIARFQYVESRISAVGKSLRDLSPGELDVFWQEAKSLGGVHH